MVKFWVWTSEIIFFLQLPFIQPSLKNNQSRLILVARYVLNGICVAWWFSSLPWIFLLVALLTNFKLYGYQIRTVFEAEKVDNFKLRLFEFIAFFSILNFTLVLPFWNDPNKAISRTLHTLINVLGIAVIVYSIVIQRLHDAWSCYNSAVFPDKTDYIYGMCPENINDESAQLGGICRRQFIHCDDREPLRNGQLFYEIASTLVVSSGTLYIFGCPFF